MDAAKEYEAKDNAERKPRSWQRDALTIHIDSQGEMEQN